MKKWKFFAGLIGAVLFCAVVAKPAVADWRPPVACDQQTGIGAVFHDFDKIVIYYAAFPHPDTQKLPEYSEALRFENVNRMLVDAIKKNFALCLTSASGEEKPIVIVRPGRMYSHNIEGALEHDKLSENAFDPKNLVVVVSLAYRPDSHMMLDYDPSSYKHDPLPSFALFEWAIHRGGMSGIEGLPLISNRSGSEILFPEIADLFEQQLTAFGSSIRPLKIVRSPHVGLVPCAAKPCVPSKAKE